MNWLKSVPFLNLCPNRSLPKPTRNGANKITIKVDTNPATNPNIKGISERMKAVAQYGIKAADFDNLHNLYSYTETTTIAFKPRKKHRLIRKKRQRDYSNLIARNVNAQIENLRRDLGL